VVQFSEIITPATLLTEEFVRYCNDIFEFEVDNKVTDENVELAITREMFWSNIYKERDEENLHFHSFLKSDAPLCIITGHVGSGKSTFIRHKYEHRKLCKGILIDIREVANTIISSDKIDENFKKVIREYYYDSIIRNISYSLVSGIKLGEPFKDIDFDYSIDLKHLKEKFDERTTAKFAKKQLAYHACLLSSKNRELENYIDDLKIVYSSDKVFKKKILAKLDDTQHVKNIISILSYRDLIILHQNLFKSDLPHILTFDNLDKLDLIILQNKLFDCMISIIDEVNKSSEIPFTTILHKPIKVIVSIRDENISRYNIRSAVTTRSLHISMGYNNYAINSRQDPLIIPIDSHFVYKVIIARLDALKDRTESSEAFNLYSKIAYGFWLNNKSEILNRSVGHIDIKDLCNNSIRMILDVINETSLSIIRKFQEKNISMDMINDNFPYSIIKGRIIRSFWVQKATIKLMSSFRDSLIKEKDNYCCFYRLILIYLYNKKSNMSCELQSLVQDFSSHFSECTHVDISECDECRNGSAIRKNLLNLFSNKFKESDLLSIYQDKLIDNYNDIDDLAIVKLNTKGAVFIERILLHMDFYGAILESEHKLTDKTLMELLPDEAFTYIASIYKFVNKLTISHIEFWCKTIVDKMQCEESTICFKEYSKRYAFKDQFHLERVCASHQALIKIYLSELFRGPNSHFLYSPAQREEFRQINSEDLIQKERIRTANDIEIQSIINKYFKDNASVKKIWDINFDYKKSSEKFQHLKLLSFKDLNKIVRED